jgi:hypothetical protein
MATAAVPKSDMDASSWIAAMARKFASDAFGRWLAKLTNKLF